MRKILAIKFKFLGDVAVTIPAFRSIKDTFPGVALHVAVAEDAVPILKFLPWIDRIWQFPRGRGKIAVKASCPIIRAIRRERFDTAIDFVGNDRGAILTLLSGANNRLGPVAPRGFLCRRFCYRRRIQELPLTENEIRRNLHIAAQLGARSPLQPEIDIVSDRSLASKARQMLGENRIVCHVSTRQPKKDWPLRHWVEFHQLVKESGRGISFSSGPTERERELAREIARLEPSSKILPRIDSLDLFLAVIKEADLFISADTGPLHFAAGLGVPTLSLFGPSERSRWAPLGPKHRNLSAPRCLCPLAVDSCLEESPCMALIQPKKVFECLEELESGICRT